MELFHSIEIFIQRCEEMMKVEKKQDKIWAKRMHTSFKCYKENLITLFTIEKRLEKFRNDKHNEQCEKQSENLVDLDWNESENRLRQENKTVDSNENLLDEDSLKILACIKSKSFSFPLISLGFLKKSFYLLLLLFYRPNLLHPRVPRTLYSHSQGV